MNAEILCVGTELLLGDVVNTNAAEIARELASLGINVYHQEVVGDNPDRLKESLARAFQSCDLVVLTGGLGPTYDDLTKETVAAYFGKQLVMDEVYLAKMQDFFAHMGREMTENNKKQAMMPEGCHVLDNPNGTAPGCIIDENGKIAVMMPGPPREMRPMLAGPMRDYLTRQSDSILFSKVLNFFGVGESALEQRLRTLMIDSENPTVAPYAKTGECQLRITARAKNAAEALALIEPVAQKIRDEYQNGEIYGEDFVELNDAAVQILSQNGHTLAAAESCTGGLVAARIVERASASQMFLGSVVAYANQAKQALLKVSAHTLDTEGAVSEQCALEMARGARLATHADIGIATTGIAGPEGGSDEKPVGTVFVAVSSKEGEVVKKLHLARGRADDRETIRNLGTCHALKMAIDASRRLKANTDK